MFCLADVCKVLDLQNPTTVKNRLDQEDVKLIDLHALNYAEGSVFGNTKTNFVTESGFYDVILQSSSSKVKPFRKWITSVVLPSIRKTGKYEVNAGESKNISLRDKMDWISFTKDTLRLNDTSVLMLMHQVADPLGLPLPPYLDFKGHKKSATDLLKERNCNISAKFFNKKAIEKGFLQEMFRNTSRGIKKPFKVITEKGLTYGENQVTPNNPKETQPLWYESKFDELLAVLDIKVGRAAV